MTRRARHDGLDLDARPRGVRGLDRLHDRARGGVRARRPRDSLELVHRFEELLRRVPWRDELLAESVGRRADRHRDRDPLRPGRDLRRGGRAPARAARGGCSPTPSELRHRAGGDRAPIRGPTTSTSRSSTPSTTAACARSCAGSRSATTPGACTSTSGVRGADRAIAVCDHLRERAAAAARRSPRTRRSSTASDTGLHSVRTEIFTRTFPRCGVHEPFGDWAHLRGLHRAADARPDGSSSRPSCGGACARTTPSAPSSCGSATPRRAATRRSTSPR